MREICLFEPVHGRYPDCDENCENCGYWYVESEEDCDADMREEGGE